MNWLSKFFSPAKRRVASSSIALPVAVARAKRFAGDLAEWSGVPCDVQTVSNTNSMIPTLDENCALLVEKCSFDEISEGDIVVAQAAPSVWKRPEPFTWCHRTIAKTATGWQTKGDGNSAADPEEVRFDNFLGRVAGVFYTKRTTQTDQ